MDEKVQNFFYLLILSLWLIILQFLSRANSGRLHLRDPFFRDEVLQSEEGEGRKEGRERSSGRGRRDKSRAGLPQDSKKSLLQY